MSDRGGSNMEIRKVQMTGGSSYVISLPKGWIKAMSIKKNDPLGIVTQSDGSLVVTTRISGEQMKKTKVFDIDHIDHVKEPNYLYRYLIGAYIAGYANIKIKSSTGIPPFVRMGVRKFTQMTIGQEVVEEAQNQILLKDLLNPAEMPFDNTIKRMHILVNGMHLDTMAALVKKEPSLAEDVISRDNDVNRLHWLVARQYNIVSRNMSLAEKMDLSVESVGYYYLISRILERMGDHAVIIARYVPNLITKRTDKEIIESLTSSSEMALKIFNNSMDTFYSKDIRLANQNIESVAELVRMCDDTESLARQHKGILAVSVGYITESIRRTGEYSADLSEQVINYVIGEQD